MTGPLVWGIIGFLCLVFAIWGIGADSFFGGGANPTLAEVGGQKITQSAFQQAYNQKYQQLLQLMGDSFDPSEIDQKRFSAGVLDTLIQQTLLQQYANQAGYVAPDSAVYAYLSQIPAFQVDGKFSAKAYRSTLASVGRSTDQFEAQIGQALRVQQLRRSVLATAFLVPKQLTATWRVTNETRDISQVVFAPSAYAQTVKISDDQVRQYYDKHKSQFIAPQRMKLAYIELSQAKLAPTAKPDADVLKAIYEVQKHQRFTTPGQRQASHILIHFGPDKAAALKTAQSVEAKLAAGGDFAKLAKQYSDDPGSKNKGGSLGWLGRGTTAPAFEKALFGLSKAGDVSQPVETKFGWDIIRLDDVRPSHVKPFSDPQVQAKLLETYRSRAASKAYEDASSSLTNLVYENPHSLKPAADKLGLKVQTTDWFTRKGGSGITANKAVIQAAFSQEVLENGENSKPLTIAAAEQVVVRKLKAQPERQLAFADVKTKIHQTLASQAEQAKAKAAAKALATSVRNGKSLQAAADAAGVAVKKREGLKRTDTQDAALIAAVFGLASPEKGAPASVGVVKLNGSSKGYAVLVLDAVHRVEPKAGSNELQTAASAYNQALAGAEFAAYQASMKQKISVKREQTPVSQQAASGS